ncbi:MAG: hypothetical protein ACOC8D_03200 [bacterium]
MGLVPPQRPLLPSVPVIALMATTAAFGWPGLKSDVDVGDLVFPEDAGVINLQKPPYNAAGDGEIDDTEAVQPGAPALVLRALSGAAPAGIACTLRPLWRDIPKGALWLWAAGAIR